ncbi:MAG TPA: hypothetical protein P5235_11125 [Saprospiraceae bacterium]|nr:hypothetical protein [Saprospiraceae bacterium]HRX29930.1 hypothetical protein [Saprospiraceae bacterium]
MLNSLSEWYLALSSGEQIIWGIAILSTGIFLLQIIISLIGMDADFDVDIDHGGDIGLLSFRAIISFLVFFSWTSGILLSKGWSMTSALLVGFLVGFMAMSLVAYALYKISSMEESGNIDLQNSVGLIGEVYIPIPQGQLVPGKVSLIVDDKIMELDAVAKEHIKTGTQIKVLSVLKNNVLLVEPLNNVT